MDEIKNKIIAVWFSCGAASAVAAKLALEKYGKHNEVKILNNPVLEEDEDNRRFRMQVGAWLGVQIELVLNPKWPSASAIDVWNKRKFMSGPKGAPCTGELKIQARQIWEKNNHADWHVLGFTSEEKDRFERFKLTERKNTLAPLIDQNLSKQDCFDVLLKSRLILPRVYSLGYPNANCIGCVKTASPEYWNHVRKVHPSVFKSRAEQSRAIGAKLVRVKGRRIFLDELREQDKGRPMKQYQFECGIFCEEK
jgi:hypothetical protein